MGEGEVVRAGGSCGKAGTKPREILEVAEVKPLCVQEHAGTLELEVDYLTREVKRERACVY